VITSASQAWDTKGKNVGSNVTVILDEGESIKWRQPDDKYIDMVLHHVDSVKIAGGSDHR